MMSKTNSKKMVRILDGWESRTMNSKWSRRMEKRNNNSFKLHMKCLQSNSGLKYPELTSKYKSS